MPLDQFTPGEAVLAWLQIRNSGCHPGVDAYGCWRSGVADAKQFHGIIEAMKWPGCLMRIHEPRFRGEVGDKGKRIAHIQIAHLLLMRVSLLSQSHNMSPCSRSPCKMWYTRRSGV